MKLEQLNLASGRPQQVSAEEGGFTMIEVLVSLVLLSIFSLALVMNTTKALQFAKFTEANHIASSLAISKMEEIAAIDTASIDSSLSGVETAVTWPGVNFTFTRTTTVTINADDSRTVDIVVSSNNSPIPTTVNFTSSFAVWE